MTDIQLQFKEIPLRTEVDWLYGFLFTSPWRSVILKKHPGLSPVLTLSNEAKRVAFIRAYVEKTRDERRDDIIRAEKSYRALWHRIGPRCVEALSQLMQVHLTRDRRATALLSIDPICPRFLKTWSFSIYFDYRKPEHALEVMLHEICHFLYFRKWHEIFPNHRATRFEAPDIVWHLSELMASILLNDPDIRSLWGGKAVFYKEHMRLRIGKISVPAFYTRMYRDWKKTKAPFDDFLRQAFVFTERHAILFQKSGF